MQRPGTTARWLVPCSSIFPLFLTELQGVFVAFVSLPSCIPSSVYVGTASSANPQACRVPASHHPSAGAHTSPLSSTPLQQHSHACHASAGWQTPHSESGGPSAQ